MLAIHKRLTLLRPASGSEVEVEHFSEKAEKDRSLLDVDGVDGQRKVQWRRWALWVPPVLVMADSQVQTTTDREILIGVVRPNTVVVLRPAAPRDAIVDPGSWIPATPHGRVSLSRCFGQF
jgi:hypothetical protein